MRCIIVYTTLEPYMGELISTILTYFRGLGGGGPVPQVVTSPKKIVSTQAQDCYSTSTQTVSNVRSPGQGKSKGMRHSLYSCKCLVYSRIGRGPHPPNPRIRGVGWARVPLYIYPNFFKPIFHVSTTHNFLHTHFKLLVP